MVYALYRRRGTLLEDGKELARPSAGGRTSRREPNDCDTSGWAVQYY